jgi:hypothetical protein
MNNKKVILGMSKGPEILGALEYWSTGVLEQWNNSKRIDVFFATLQYSITPVLQVLN